MARCKTNPLIAVFLLFSSFAIALDPGTIGSSQVTARLYYDISLPSAVTSAVFNTYAFGNASFQSASFSASDPYSLSKDAYGNTVLSFSFDPNGTAREFWIEARLNVSYDPASFDFEGVSTGTGAGTGAGVDYLSPSALAKIDPSITSLADSVVPRGADDYEAARSLASWVHNYITYDPAYTDKAYDSVTTLRLRRGTCDEKSHLLIALLRSKGIPARHAVGFAYSGTDWQLHAWTEALIGGKWVPIDSTFNEMFFPDASHLRLAVGRDQDDTKYSISAIGTNNLSGTTVSARFNVSFASTRDFSDFFDLSASFPVGINSPSGQASVNATAFNKLYDRQIAVPLSLSTERNFSVIGSGDQLVLVAPRQSANESWGIVFPPAVEGGYIYNYSCVVSAYSKQATGYLLESNGQGAPLVQAAAIEGFSASQGPDGVALSFSVRNTGNADLANVTLGYESQDLSLSKTIGSIPLGSSVQGGFTIPYYAIPDPSRLRGNITLRIGTQSIVTALDVGLSPSGSTPGPSQGMPYPVPETSIVAWALLAAFTAIVLTLLMSIIVRKRRRKQP